MTLRTYTTPENLIPVVRSETVPVLVPSTAEQLFTGDVWLEEVHLCNGSANPVTVTITDGNGVVVVPSVTISAYSDHLREFSGRYCPGGVSWVASAADSVVGYVRCRR